MQAEEMMNIRAQITYQTLGIQTDPIGSPFPTFSHEMFNTTQNRLPRSLCTRPSKFLFQLLRLSPTSWPASVRQFFRALMCAVIISAPQTLLLEFQWSTSLRRLMLCQHRLLQQCCHRPYQAYGTRLLRRPMRTTWIRASRCPSSTRSRLVSSSVIFLHVSICVLHSTSR